MSKTKISIIVPVYNVEKYIDRCLNSLVNQTLKEIEIIIVNDNTPDNSMKICEQYASKDNRIKIYNKTINEGLGITRNYGITKANGEFIAFVDSDDYVDKDFYEKMYNKAIETKTDICIAEYKKNLNKSSIIKNKIPFKNDIEDTKSVLHNMLSKKYINNNAISSLETCVWQGIYKKSIMDKNNINFVSEREYLAEDSIFNFDYLMNSKKASFVRGTYYHYCFNELSLTHSYIPNRIKKIKLLKDKLIEQAKKYEVLEEFYTVIMSRFLVKTRQTIREEIDYGKTTKEVLKNIKKIVNDEEVRVALKNRQKDEIKNEIFNFLIKTKQAMLLIIMHKIANKLKNRKQYINKK